MEEPLLIEFGKIGNEEIGFISVAEFEKNIPFAIKRVFWVYNTPGATQRGDHAHRNTLQVLIALKGQIRITLENKTGKRSEFLLSSPDKGLYVPSMHWRKLSFSEDAICLSITSSGYDENDYIRDYQSFLALNNE